MKLYRIGELSKVAQVSPRTIDYYTKLGLIGPEKRSDHNYRYYSDETLMRLHRIVSMKKEKYTLEEIKESLQQIQRVSKDEGMADKVTSLQLHMKQLEKEVKEIGPLLAQLKPIQAQRLLKLLSPQSAACIEALLLIASQGPLL